MSDIIDKCPDSETNTITSIQSEQEISQGPKIPERTEQTDYHQFEELPLDALDLAASFQKMTMEEQWLLETKQHLLAKQHDLQNKLVKEIEKKKATIVNLTSEIPSLQNRNKQLEQALGIGIYK